MRTGNNIPPTSEPATTSDRRLPTQRSHSPTGWNVRPITARSAVQARMGPCVSMGRLRLRAKPHRLVNRKPQICAHACPKTVWASGRRRWIQAPVRKGVGSNPTAVICKRCDAHAPCNIATLYASNCGDKMWTNWGLNPGPPACSAGVIPLHHSPVHVPHWHAGTRNSNSKPRAVK